MQTLMESVLRNRSSTIDRADRESRPLGEHLRGQLISELEACLVDSDLLDAYLLTVQQVAQENVCEGTLAKEREKLVAEQGLSVLTDDELLHLAFGPDALVNLWDRIELTDEYLEYWADRFAQAGEAGIAALPEDKRQALLARRKAFEQEFLEMVRKGG